MVAIEAAPALPTSAMHSTASPDWGTPEIVRRFAICVLRPAAIGTTAIDIDYASSAYWNQCWPDASSRPHVYLDGSKGRDVLRQGDRVAALDAIRARGGTAFENPPGLNGGEMVQACWRGLVEDHEAGIIGSGFWVGFSLEQLASLQNAGDDDGKLRHPLTTEGRKHVTSIFPSRRTRYILHPEAMIGVIRKKQARRIRGSKEWRQLESKAEALMARNDDSPVAGDAPSHASYFTILWHADRTIRRRQVKAAREFLRGQAQVPKSLFARVAVVGWPSP